jgi:hypothetical protein
MCRSARKNPRLSRIGLNDDVRADGRVRRERRVDNSFDPRTAPPRVSEARPTGNNTRRAPIAVVDRRAAGRGTDAGRDVVETGGDGRTDTHPGSGRGGVGGGLRGGRGADRPADGRGASLDASSRDASFRGRDGGRRGGDGEGGHAHAGCGTSVGRSKATDSRVSAGASGAGRRPRASTPDSPDEHIGVVSPDRKKNEDAL